MSVSLLALKYKQNLFNLPNGSCLKYAFPETKGNQFAWFNSWDNSRLYKNEKEKTRQPKLGLLTSGSAQFLLAADFDVLPRGFNSYDALYSFLNVYKSENQITIRTSSNKVKALILFECATINLRNSYFISSQLLIETVREFLPLSLQSAFDPSKSALTITFLNPNNVRLLSNKLKLLHPILLNASILPSPVRPGSRAGLKLVSPHVEQQGGESIILTPKENVYKIYLGVLPFYLAEFIEKNTRLEGLVRILLTVTPLLSGEGFQLPTTTIAEALGKSYPEEKYYHQRIGRYLKALVRLGELKIISEDWSHNKRYSKTYIATGSLLRALKELSSLVCLIGAVYRHQTKKHEYN